MSYETRDSGEREDFGNGSVRDTNAGKPRPDLISPKATYREAMLMARGAEKYGERNWEKGQLVSRFVESLTRHTLNYLMGDRVEDHPAAIRYNAGGIAHFEGTEWDDVNEDPDQPGMTYREVHVAGLQTDGYRIPWIMPGDKFNLSEDTSEPDVQVLVDVSAKEHSDGLAYLVRCSDTGWMWENYTDTNHSKGFDWNRVCELYKGMELEVLR